MNQIDYLEINEIPNLDLYMDQVLSLVNSKKIDNSKKITKTMINNYSKAKLLTPVKGKKYTKNQIIQILIIDLLKNHLSLIQIHDLLKLKDENELTNLYQKLINFKKESQQAKVNQILTSLNLSDNNLLNILILSSIKDQLQIQIDTYL